MCGVTFLLHLTRLFISLGVIRSDLRKAAELDKPRSLRQTDVVQSGDISKEWKKTGGKKKVKPLSSSHFLILFLLPPVFPFLTSCPPPNDFSLILPPTPPIFYKRTCAILPLLILLLVAANRVLAPFLRGNWKLQVWEGTLAYTSLAQHTASTLMAAWKIHLSR